MKRKNYKKYTKEEMTEICKNKGCYFVRTSNGDNFYIAKDDLEDFIIKETSRCEHDVRIFVYTPVSNEPILTTFGWFLDKINPKLREEIIERLVRLQCMVEEPREVKIFDEKTFENMLKEDMELNHDNNKFFEKYYEEEELEV